MIAVAHLWGLYPETMTRNVDRDSMAETKEILYNRSSEHKKPEKSIDFEGWIIGRWGY